MKSDDQLLIDSLKVFGLSKQEQDVFIFIAGLPNGINAKWLGLELDMPRQTVNSILKKLAKQNLLQRRTEQGMHIFAVTKDLIEKFADEKCRSLQQAAAQIIRILAPQSDSTCLPFLPDNIQTQSR